MEEALWFALVFGALALLWRINVAARATANEAAHAACAEAGVQLLDGTVVFRSWRFARGADDRMAFRRNYVFDYSDDGVSRRQGFVILRGRDVELIGLGPTLVQTTVH
jgi:Protein of unknown function (DUF3301)